MNDDAQINKDLFFYLVRHYRAQFPKNPIYCLDKPHLTIVSREYKIEGNKQYLKNKIYSIVEEEKPEWVDTKENISRTYKTIKEFLDSAKNIKK